MSWNSADAVRLVEIFGINLILSGDNAVVVGMVLRKLPIHQRKIASTVGISAAVLIQYAATLTVASLLRLRAVSCLGGILLVWIAINLLRDNGASATLFDGSSTILYSIATVTADYLVMCPDNILAVAAVAQSHVILLALGLFLSCGLLIPGSLFVAEIMKRYPLLVTAGATLLGWTAGAMIVSTFDSHPARLAIPFFSVLLVITSPWWLGSRHLANRFLQSAVNLTKDRSSG